ncbi:MAG TPA: sensor histidine kinase [Lachnospiraceae bacterium]
MKVMSQKRLALRFSFFYVLVASIVIIIAMLAYNRLYRMQEKEQRIKILKQSSESVASSIESMVQMIQQNSFSVLGDEEIQTILKTKDISFTEASTRVRKNVSYWAIALPFVDSIYVLKNGGGIYGMDKISFRGSALSDVKMTSWYSKVESLEGYFTLEVNGDYFLKKNKAEVSVSFLRLINDVSDFQPLGVLMVNIGNEHLQDVYAELAKDTGIIFYITDKDGSLVSYNGAESKKIWDKEKRNFQKNKTKFYKNSEGQEYLLQSTQIKNTDWYVRAVLPYKSEWQKLHFRGGYFLIILLTMLIVFAFSFVLMLIEVAHPIEKMIKSMDSVDGKMHKMTAKVPRGELSIMKDKYNALVGRNESLISQINVAQQTKRKAELRVLQEQIKPHFLYNTINAMQYLCAMKKTEELYDALEAFGRFYQLSLSKGKEVVTLGEEIEIVESYMCLQRLRYGAQLDYRINVDKKLYPLRVLKLILQPLVENSIYHGIKEKARGGLIEIGVNLVKEDKYILISVKDDGVGMDDYELSKVKGKALLKNPESFGLRATVERLNTFYQEDVEYRIESRKGNGTKIEILVPVRYGIRL